MQKKILIIFLSLLFVSFGQRVSAADTQSPKDLFRFDDIVEISAPVTGDLYVAGREVLLRGDVEGDVLALGRNVVIAGSVKGDVRIVGDSVTVTGSVNGSVSVASRSLTVTTNAVVGKNLTFLGQAIDIASAVKGDAKFFMIDPSETRIRESAVIDGVVAIRSSDALTIDEGAILRHPIERTAPSNEGPSVLDILFSRIIAFFSLLLIGLVVAHIFFRPSLIIASLMSNRPWRNVLFGSALLFLPPLVVLVLLFTVIGIPIALILGALWAMLVYSARVFAGFTIGLHTLAYVDKRKVIHSPIFPLCIGIGALTVLESIPYIGLFVTFFATLWALGGIAVFVRSFVTEPKKAKT